MNLLIAEDLKIANEALCQTLAQSTLFDQIFSACNGRDAVKLYSQHFPDIVLLDVEIPHKSGIRVAEFILKKHPRTRVILMTAYENETTICNIRSLRGISGCILKAYHALADYEVILHKIMIGEQFFSSQFSQLVHQYLASNLCLTQILSAKQRKILGYVGAGYRDEQIAELMGSSYNTVRGQVRSLREKLGVYDRVDLMAIAHEKGCAKSDWKKMDLVGNYEMYG